MKKNGIFSTSTQILESVYVSGHTILSMSKVHIKAIEILLNLKSISFIGNRSLFFITVLILCDEGDGLVAMYMEVFYYP